MTRLCCELGECRSTGVQKTSSQLIIFDESSDRATVTMEFITRPEQVKVGQKMLFREGKCKGLGT